MWYSKYFLKEVSIEYLLTIGLTLFQAGSGIMLSGGGTVGRFALSVAKNRGGLGPSETKSESIFRPIVMIF